MSFESLASGDYNQSKLVQILDGLIAGLDADVSGIAFRLPGSDDVFIIPRIRGETYDRVAVTQSPASSYCQMVIDEKRSISVVSAFDGTDDQRCNFMKAGEYESFLGVPVFATDGSVRAAVAVAGQSPRNWTQADQDALNRASAEIFETPVT